jgi:YHS domain-containing protein
MRVEGSVVPLKEREFVHTVLARSPETEVESALVLATPEQIAKLHDFLRVHDVAPATDGIYVGHTGTWFAVRHNEVAESGQWLISTSVLTSFAEATTQEAAVQETPAPVMATTAPSDVAEPDPVCGTAIKPGLEAANVTYQGHTYHFCSAECRALFLEAPARYIRSPAGASAG